jgi:molybdate transport system ATP-binding protein
MVREPRRLSRYIEVELRRVRLERGGRLILRDIDWTLSPGQRWVLAGANGAGKTQLMKLVAGAVWPTPTGRERRRYIWRGENHATPYGVSEEIAYIGAERQDRYERYGWNHTVEQIVGTGLHRTDIPLNPVSRRDRRKIATLLARLDLTALAARRFLTLSYGERRLTLLARALAARPKLLLLDELTNGLDARNRAQALHWLNAARTRMPWVLSTHHVQDVPRSATHALVLARGAIVYRGPIARAPLERWLTRRPLPRSKRGTPVLRPPKAVPLTRLVRSSVYLAEQPVLEDISLELEAGQCWVVHGPNGSGKSTLLRTVYGDHSVAAGGRIERAGIQPGVPLEVFKRKVGLVAPHLQAEHPQELRVREVVESGLHASIGLAERPRIADRTAAARTLRAFGLHSLAERSLRELSYGEMRRVLFARAVVGTPSLLLLDEAFAGLDAPTRHALMRETERLAARGVTLLIATHHRDEWPRCVTHELELDRGRTRYSGPVRSSVRAGRGGGRS